MIIAGILLLFFAGLLRFHITVLAMIVFSAFVFSSLAKKYSSSMALMSGTVILLILLYHGQRNFYIRNIPGWSQQERYRQALFFASNRPVAKAGIISITR